VKVKFKKSFTRDLKKRANDRKLFAKVEQIIGQIEEAEDTHRISNLKNSKHLATITGSAPGIIGSG